MDKRLVILILNFLTMATFNMAHPVTPKLITELGLPSFMFGVFFACMSIANFVMAPIWGRFSDSKGRKRFLVIGVIGYGLSQVGFGISTAIFPIIIFRFLGGAFAICFITSAIAYISDISTTKDRAKYLAFLAASTSIGASLGSFSGGVIGQNVYQYTFLTQGVLSIILMVLILLIIKETVNPNKDKVSIYLDHLKPKKKIFDLHTALGSMIVVMTLITITTTSYNSTINYYIESVLNMPTTVNGTVMAIAGIIALFMNLVINPFLSKRFNEYKSIMYTTLISGIAIAIAMVLNNGALSIALLLIFIASSSLLIPMHQSIVTKLAKDNYGEVMGIQGSAKALGMLIGSLMSGFIFMVNPSLPFVLAGVSSIVAFFLLRRLTNKLLNK